jgi:CRISPR-associated protein Cmr4
MFAMASHDFEGKSRGESLMTETSYESYSCVGMALDPIHVGTGGSRLGRVDNTIVRDPVTRIPKIPGSSLAGVMRAYVAMNESKYPECAGQGQEKEGNSGHCGKPDCKVCTVFGFSKGDNGGFAGLAGFSDMHVLLFPVPTREGPVWVTSPMALKPVMEITQTLNAETIYRKNESSEPLNLGWLMLEVKSNEIEWNTINTKIKNFNIPDSIKNSIVLVPDNLFSHIVNSNLEVRTSVAINPATGAAEDGALFTYEALPRTTILYWEVTCRNPKHFQINSEKVSAVEKPEVVFNVVKNAHDLMEHLGIGGMGTRGMGRLDVIYPIQEENQSVSQTETQEVQNAPADK